MTFTYDSTSISTSLAKVRLILGDTNSADPLLTDEEINYFLTLDSNVFGAASMGASAIQANFSRLADTSVEGVSVRYSQKADQYGKLSIDLARAKNENNPVTPSVFGVSISDIESNWDDSDRVQSRFRVGQFDNPPSDYSDDVDYDDY